jgi:predicted metal-dependent peptidase
MGKGALDTALEQLWRQSRFTSYFFQSVQARVENSIPTLALAVFQSRTVLLYNEDFVFRLTADELIGLLAHEMLHVVLAHDHRGLPGDDVRLRNIAQDMVINSYLGAQRTTFFSGRGAYVSPVPRLVLPRGLPVVPDVFARETGIQDPSWEELYRWLKKQERAQVAHYLDGFHAADAAPRGSEVAAADSLRRVLRNPLQIPADEIPAEHFSLGDLRGLAFFNRDEDMLPTGVHLFHGDRELASMGAQRDRVIAMASADEECREERSCQEIKGIINRAAEVDISSWKRQLHSVIDFSSQSNEWVYTYGRFNRRYYAGGIFAPGRIFREQERITVAVDVSASMVMRPKEIEAAFGVIEEILGKYRINLVCIDENLFIPEKKGGPVGESAGARGEFIYARGDWRFLKTGSSGTTFFAPLFNEYMRRHRELLIVITDGEIYDLQKLRRYTPTVWVLPERRRTPFEPPFGRTVTVKTGTRQGVPNGAW